MTSRLRSGTRIVTSKAFLMGAVLLVTLLSACSGAERPTLVEGPEAVGNSESGEDTTASTDPDDDVDRDPIDRATDAAAAGGLGMLDEPEPITGDVIDPVGSFKAITTAAGVVTPVIGQTAEGYVVQSPCGFERLVSWGQPVGDVQVVLDAGHGGIERGAETDEMAEADLNLRVVRRTASELNDRGIAVVLSRTGDYRMPVIQRTFLADHVEAELLVSVHHNTPAVNPSPTPGTEMYVQNGSTDSRRLGGLIYEEVVEALAEFDVEWVSRSDAGVLAVLNDEGADAYGINRRPTVPSVLAELAYLGNPKEAALLATDDYADAMAAALADGIERYLTTQDPGSGFVEQARSFSPSGDTGGEEGCIDPVLE